jgi:beta-galactosidase
VQPQGAGFGHFALCFDLYRALRGLGLSADIVGPDVESLDGYALVLVPGVLELGDPLRAAMQAAEGIVLTGPRTGLKTGELGFPLPLGPEVPGLDATSVMEETFPPDAPRALEGGGAGTLWLEHLEGDAEVVERVVDGPPALVRSGRRVHLAAWPDAEAARRILGGLAREAGLEVREMPEGLRVRQAGGTRFVFNYGTRAQVFEGREVAAAGGLRLA